MVLAVVVFVSADITALVATLLVPAVPGAGSVVAAPPEPPLHPANSRANATQTAINSSLDRPFVSPLSFIQVVLSLGFPRTAGAVLASRGFRSTENATKVLQVISRAIAGSGWRYLRGLRMKFTRALAR